MCDIGIGKISSADLMDYAKKARENSYSPYSNFRVGAAVISNDGKVYTGTNIENASYGASICAERVAIHNAINNGAKAIRAIAINADRKEIFPCGICRQVMSEFSSGEDIKVFIEESNGKILEYKLSELLPNAFKL